jgi:hypothetical protein
VSISEAAVPGLAEISDSEDEEEVAERRNGEGGTKRKAPINQGEESDEDEKGAEESEAHQILSGAEAFWKTKFSKVSPSRILISYFKMMLIIIFKASPPLTRKGGYYSTSHANILKKQTTLCKGAAGLAKINGFFASVPKTHQTTN